VLFNSFPFLFLFLPVAFIGGFMLFRANHNRAGLAFMAACSLFFYGYWKPAHLWVIVLSILVNYLMGGAIAPRREPLVRRLLLVAGIAFNLGMLGYFKYLGFFSHMFTVVQFDSFFDNVVNTALPIGISFYTFQQIAFLIDSYNNIKHRAYSFVEYVFFVSFFPQLIAGPIVHHAEIMPQLEHLAQRLRGARYVTRYLVPGMALLVIGLAKKVLLADTFGVYADGAFAVASLDRMTFFDAWASAVAYTLQIYFDFSGYSDMAIGLAFLFGLHLPINFNAPYKAASMIDFWRRWHITLSRFLRDYLYFPLGGNRRGPALRYLNLLATMMIGGLWHGANWTFLFWGFLHGALLAVNHALRSVTSRRPPVWLAVGATFIIIVFTWVPFRAEGFAVVQRFYYLMLGFDGVVVPQTYGALIPALGDFATVFNIRAGDVGFFSGIRQVAFTAAGLAIVFFGPVAMALLEPAPRRRALRSKLVPVGLGIAATLVFLVMWVQSNVTFLYFQF